MAFLRPGSVKDGGRWGRLRGDVGPVRGLGRGRYAADCEQRYKESRIQVIPELRKPPFYERRRLRSNGWSLRRPTW